MKCYYKTINLFFWAAVLLPLVAACDENAFPACEDDTPACIRVSAAPMILVGEQVPYAGTRAGQSLPPEYENSIYSLTVLVFDVKEGVLGKFPIKDGMQKLYKYINLKDENGNGLPRDTRCACKEQYAEAVRLLCGNSYMTVQEVADTCGLSYTGLEQHLLFYHKDLVKQRIRIREKALRSQRRGEITGRGTVHAPSGSMVEKYSEAVHLFSTISMSAAQIARKTGVSRKGFYEHLQRWHPDLICKRKEVPYKEGQRVDWSQVRKYNPATKEKYTEAIRRLKESGLPTAQIASELGLHLETFRSYLKEHEPELHAMQGMVRTDNGKMVSRRIIERYGEAMRLYGTTAESVTSLAERFGFNACSFGQFIRRNFPELVVKHNEIVRNEG